ncbi:Na+/H+ antiporter NhaA [Sphingosinicella sp.]|uniref:Na+/H+ antiporter NhaA n=1 Tax=Sphingosinicella sp. TaxID=1917971 RepID=UPI004037A1C5
MNAAPFARTSVLRRFLSSEAAGGIVLMAAAALALVVANSGLAETYQHWLHAETGPTLSPKLGPMTVHLWINDGLMAVFFLFVGLEIRREFVDGRLASWRQRRLPMIAAAAGMIVPALLYLLVAGRTAGLANGWAIPAATDIAFAIGVLALLGSRAPASLKLFLTTVAIVDDLGAVAIIALAYTSTIDTLALGAAAAIWFVMVAMGKSGVARLWPYLILAAGLWYAVLLSGVHATVAGVLAAAAIPVVATPGAPDDAGSPLHRLEHALAPLVAFAIVPLFGFANAGVSVTGLGVGALLAPLPLAIATGLFLGKQLGIFAAVRLCCGMGLASPLRGATWLQVYGVAILCGIGFTMSLFIGALAFAGRADLIEEAKVGILAGSFLSAVAGYLVLRFAAPRADFAAVEARANAEIDGDGDSIMDEESRA